MAHVAHESTAFVPPGSSHVKQNQGMNNYVSLFCPDYVGTWGSVSGNVIGTEIAAHHQAKYA